MERYIAIDAGKHSTKAAMYDTNTKKTIKYSYRTKIGAGDFRDDSIEANTHVFEIDGQTYKIGNGARGDGALLETSKQSIEHKLSILYAIAHFASDTEVDEINIAIGLPAKEWANVEKREALKEYIFDKNEYTISIKEDSNSPVVTKTFKIKHKYAYPESMGALWQDDSPEVTKNSYFGVLDIGNLNLNATVWYGIELQQDVSITDELGASSIIQGLSQELSAEFSRCDENYVSMLLSQSPERRFLRPNNGDTTVMERSRDLISKYLLEHAGKIKRACDGRKWSLDYMTLVAIGGTSLIIQDELKEVFGDQLVVLKNPTFCNALGYLRIMCRKELGEKIALDFA